MNNPNKSNLSSAVLHIEARSARGFIPAFGQFCVQMEFDIERVQECRVDQTLYLRVKCLMPERYSNSQMIGEALYDFLQGFDASVEVFTQQRPQKVALLLDAHTPVLEDLIASVKERRLVPVEIAYIAALDVDLEKIANRYGVPFFALPKQSGLALEQKCTELNKRYRPDLMGVAGIEHVFSASFHAQTAALLFGVQSGFVPAVSGSPKLQFSFDWAHNYGPRLMVGSSFFYSAKVEGHAIIEQQATMLESNVTVDELAIKHGQLETSLFFNTLNKIANYRVLRTDKRCIVF